MSRTLSALEQEQIRRKTRANWLLSTPALLLLLFAASGPLIIVVIYSFLSSGNYGGVVWEFSTDAWFNVLYTKDIFDDTVSLSDAHLSIFWRSVQLSFLTTVLCLFFGFPTAYFIATRPPSTRNVWLFLITIPFWTNLLIRTFAILELIRNQGVINNSLMSLGLIQEPIRMLYTDFAILVGMAYVYLPLMVLPIYASMERFDFRFVEAGYDLYASRIKVLRRIIIPIIKPGIIAGSILVFVPSLGAYVTPRVLGGGKRLMVGNLIELQFGQGKNWPLGAALAVTMLVIVMVALIFYVRLVQKSERNHG
ncbi:MAG: ABC transporter permease [Proteobacteria bacterium]|jgi:spermidine/putrescine transport system permease protein|nr:ABC transporter permease [Alphaproteobacteria bacterium]MDA0307337.1 ABC transporter permease [Pseudomonadota bacterium]MDA0908798.1 ABC transporter permease [Pseudomonadota bacterium]MDA1320354.1 ABC transporter permease [Pseudomonadota bacterium]NBR37809.1 ABC transporter permease [Alphaproteobacteria bacterium]